MTTPTTSKSQTSHKKKIWLGIIAGLMVAVLGWWAWDQFAPRPLGDRLEYIGKKDYGGWPMKRYSRYYYQTNMSREEIKIYFSKANYTSSDGILSSPELHGQDMRFSSSIGKFTVSFYKYPNRVAKTMGLPSLSADNVISITSPGYNIAKDSL